MFKKFDVDSHVYRGQRKLQRTLLNDNCSLNINPVKNKTDSETFFPVAEVKIPAYSVSDELENKIHAVVQDFGFNSWRRWSKERDNLFISVYYRSVHETNFFEDVINLLNEIKKFKSTVEKTG